MPSRPVQLLIVIFWLATAGWYIQREIRPYTRTGDRPTIGIDLADEAVRQSLPVSWTLTRTGQKKPCPVRTTVEYHDVEDEFSLHSVIRQLTLGGGIPIDTFRSTYRISRHGRIIETSTQVGSGQGPLAFQVRITARHSGDSAIVTCRIRSPLGDYDPPAEQFPVADAGTINALHPIHKLRNVRPNQRWVQGVTDSLAEAQRMALVSVAQNISGINLKQLVGQSKTTSMVAEVTGPEPFEWHGSQHDCYIIEYRGDNRTARTWVRVVDGWVLRQEATVAGDTIELQRD